MEIAFRNALLRENMDNTKFEFIPLVRQVDKEDSFQAEKLGLFFIFETKLQLIDFISVNSM